MRSLLRIERPLLAFCALGLATLIVWWTSLTYSAWSKHGVFEQVSRSFSEQVGEPEAKVEALPPKDAKWRAVVQTIARIERCSRAVAWISPVVRTRLDACSKSLRPRGPRTAALESARSIGH
jgi:hypothetical protein